MATHVTTVEIVPRWVVALACMPGAVDSLHTTLDRLCGDCKARALESGADIVALRERHNAFVALRCLLDNQLNAHRGD